MTALGPFESEQFGQQFKKLSVTSQATVNSVMKTTADLFANKDFEELQRMMGLLGTIYGHIADGLKGLFPVLM